MEVKRFNSSDTNVSKFVFEFDGNDEKKSAVAEAVLYRYESYKARTVICCSVQSGCPVGCTFCGTGRFFRRNLTTEEIVSQVKTVLETIDCDTSEIKKFQIMFMSMGEPFLNYDNLKGAIIDLNKMYPNAALLVSTSAPTTINESISDFIELSKSIDKIGLQFSVHESTDANRKKLIPTNTCSLQHIAFIGEFWAKQVGRKPFYNYCVHENNSSKEDSDRLLKIFNPSVWETTLSVICQKNESVKNSIERQLDIINNFSKMMLDGGASIRVFNPAGQDDIGGGCGQLWYFQKWLKEHELKS